MKKIFTKIMLFTLLTAASTSYAQEGYTVKVYADTEIPGIVFGVSANGKYAVGNDLKMIANNAFMWSKDTGKFQDIFGVDPQGTETNPFAALYDVADDGTAVGQFYDGTNPLDDGQVPVRPGIYKDGKWTALPGLDGVSLFADDLNGCAMKISPDGKIIGGYAPTVMGTCVPVIWENGEIRRIDNLEYVSSGAYIVDMTDDGKILAGSVDWEDGSRSPAVWKDGKMIRLIGTEPATSAPDKWEYFYSGRVQSISRDGKTVGGFFEHDPSAPFGFYYELPENFDQSEVKDVTETEQLITYVKKDNKTFYATSGAYGPAGVIENGIFTEIENYYNYSEPEYSPVTIYDSSEDETVLASTFLQVTELGSFNSPMVIVIEKGSNISDLKACSLNAQLVGKTLEITGEYTELNIFDSTGTCILTDKSNSRQISLEDLTNGLYIVNISNESEQTTVKILL